MQFTLRTLLLIVAACAILLSIPLWLSATFKRAFESDDRVQQIAFDSETWKRADPIERERTVRSQMIDELLRQHDSNGWPRAKVIELLGEPDREPTTSSTRQMQYLLGLERGGGFSLDFEYLVFRFDDEDKVIAYHTVVD